MLTWDILFIFYCNHIKPICHIIVLIYMNTSPFFNISNPLAFNLNRNKNIDINIIGKIFIRFLRKEFRHKFNQSDVVLVDCTVVLYHDYMKFTWYTGTKSYKTNSCNCVSKTHSTTKMGSKIANHGCAEADAHNS